ncbi:hypothetical protein FRC06_002246, partial [Ceratobasidium sp. 370]
VPMAKPPLHKTKLTDLKTFMEAHWITDLKCSQQAKNLYFTLPRAGTDGHYKSQATKAT